MKTDRLVAQTCFKNRNNSDPNWFNNSCLEQLLEDLKPLTTIPMTSILTLKRLSNARSHSLCPFAMLYCTFAISLYVITCMILGNVPTHQRISTSFRRPPTGMNGVNENPKKLENYDDHEHSEEVSDDDENFLAQVFQQQTLFCSPNKTAS